MGRAPVERAGQDPGRDGRGEGVLNLPPGLLARFARELSEGAALVAVLDYDGTITPIVASPDDATLAPSVRRTLARLARSERAHVAILSGRALADVRARVGLPGIIYGGCHGLLMEGPGLRFRHPSADASRIARTRRVLEAGAAAIPGARIEFKGLAVSLHYRGVPRSRRADVLALVRRVRRVIPGLRVIPGRRVFDFVPRVPWNKGAAVRWIVARVARTLRERPCVLYAGDDTTDESAFPRVRERGVTVRVGAGRTGAEFAVPTVRDLQALLRWLERFLRRREAGLMEP